MKNLIKVLSILLVFMTVVMTMSVSFATDISTSNINGQADVNTLGIQTVGNKVATILRNVGIVIAVIILMILGLKYMMGSAEEKAEYKKTMIPYVVGAGLLFGASAIAGVVVGMTSNIV